MKSSEIRNELWNSWAELSMKWEPLMHLDQYRIRLCVVRQAETIQCLACRNHIQDPQRAYFPNRRIYFVSCTAWRWQCATVSRIVPIESWVFRSYLRPADTLPVFSISGRPFWCPIRELNALKLRRRLFVICVWHSGQHRQYIIAEEWILRYEKSKGLIIRLYPCSTTYVARWSIGQNFGQRLLRDSSTSWYGIHLHQLKSRIYWEQSLIRFAG